VRFGFRKRPYVVTMEMFTMAILLAFNTADKLHFRELVEVTQLSKNELLRQLHMLVNAKILLTQVNC
jgi:DNA-binding IclR family transcriptional regulator